MTTPSKVIPVGSMWSNNGGALTTLAVNPTTAGDILVLATASYGTSDLVTAVSGGGVTTWTQLISALPSGGAGSTSLWWGVITSPGPSTITITTLATYFNFLVCQQFTMGGAGIWTADVVSSLAVGSSPIAIAIDSTNTFAYVANNGGNSVTKIILSTFTAVGSALAVGSGPYSIAIDSTSTYAYVANLPGNSVTKINLSTFLTVGLALAVGSGPISIAIDYNSTYAYVANLTTSSVTKINLSTFLTVGSALTVGSNPISIAIDSTKTYAYVANNVGNSVTKINLSTFTAVGSALAVGLSPIAIAIDSTSTYAYVANNVGNSVTKINLSTFAVVGSALAVGSSPIAIAIDSTNTYAYVANSGGNSVTKINLSTFATVGSALAVGSGPYSIAIDSTSTFAYVANNVGNSVTKINLSTFAVVGGSAYSTSTADEVSGTMPSVTPSTTGPELYIGALMSASTGGTGADPDVVYEGTGTVAITGWNYGLLFLYNPSAGLPLAEAPAWAAPVSSGYVACSALIIAERPFYAPLAPTLLSPPATAHIDATQVRTFSAIYNANDSWPMSAYALRLKIVGGAYAYWNAVTQALQPAEVWNAVTPAVANGGTISVVLPAYTLLNGLSYDFSFATQESGADLDGPFATDVAFTAQAAPVVTVTAPAAIAVGTATPTVSWSNVLAPGTSQTFYDIIIETGSFGTVPGLGTQVYTSGLVASPAGSALAVGSGPYSIAIDPTGAYAYVANEGGGTVTKINLSTFATVGSALTVGSNPYSIAIAPSTAVTATIINEATPGFG